MSLVFHTTDGVKDLSRYKNTITRLGDLATGKMYFPGTNGYFSIPNTVNNRLGNSENTIVFRMKTSSYGPNSYSSAFSTGAGFALGGINIDILAAQTRIRIGTGASSTTYSWTVAAILNTWYNYVFTLDFNNLEFKCYVNKSLIDTITFATFTPNSYAPRIGSNIETGNAGDYFKGAIDNYRIYNSLWTQKNVNLNDEQTRRLKH